MRGCGDSSPSFFVILAQALIGCDPLGAWNIWLVLGIDTADRLGNLYGDYDWMVRFGDCEILQPAKKLGILVNNLYSFK